MSKKRSRKTKKTFLAKFTILLVLVAVVVVLLCVIVKIQSAKSKEDDSMQESESTQEETSTEADNSLIADGLVIVLDPGHGFDDVGNEIGYCQYNEAYYTVLYVNEIKEKLEAYGATVFLTHDGETYPSESEMAAAIARYGLVFSSTAVQVTEGDNLFNKYERVIYTSMLNYEYGVDFFLSVHFNSYDYDSVEGCAIFYCETSPGTDISQAFAEKVMNVLGYPSNYSGIYCWSYDEAYVVTKYGDYPAALIECAFMSNASDAANIESSTWRDMLTTLIADSVVEALTGEEISD